MGNFPPMPGEEAERSNTVGEHLAALGADGFDVEQFRGPPAPAGVEYVVEWFAELSTARGSNGFSQSPITYAEIDAWARLTGRSLSPFEVDLLRVMDMQYLKVTSNAAESGRDN
jgi:hypothetical protein